MSPPLVSIVLPTYNGARFIGESIQSCLDQTYENWELIIVDDASTDKTPNLVAELAATDRRIRPARHDRNSKLPAALNTGFSLARGRLLTWTSDDNLYRPEALATMVAYMETHQDTGLVYCDYTDIDEKGNILCSTRVAEPKMLAIQNCVGCCFLYRREARDTVGEYDSALFLAEDYDYWLRISMAFRLVPLHKDLYLYRRHSNSLTEVKRNSVALATERTLRKHLSALHWAGKLMRARGHVELFRRAWARKDWRQAARDLWRTLGYAPVLGPYALGRIGRSLLSSRSGDHKPLAGNP